MFKDLKHFNLTHDFTSQELEYLIDFAIHLKKLKAKRIPHPYLMGQNIALLFDKSSTRTRAAFTVAANDLGAQVEYMGANDIQFGKKESVADTAKILGSMFDGIQLRVSDQAVVEGFIQYAGVPIWNGMTDEWHPTQAIADYMTIKEVFGSLKGLNLVFVGDGRNNVAHTTLVAGSQLGVNVTILSPKDLASDPQVVRLAQSIAKETGAKIKLTDQIKEAVQTANVIYTDVWASMGEEDKFEERIQSLLPYQVNQEMVDMIGSDYIFMHCLPAFHDNQTVMGKEIQSKYQLAEMEVTDDVFLSDQARQFQQGENRMHAIKAIMALTNGHLFLP
ncbi:ornithine carbamoyltransferase [Hutsoniella sourekii]|uniref:ornithine carbamoyltransferase n=1 Tax=Hutsoniella sourekii TaxID=87650 RepID=UPI000481D097|nr:ornithine carbamoyltransferase [Hutsoniella sourekii]